MDELMALFATQPTTTIARALLGMYLEHETPEGTVGGYIVDCEAYLGPDDLAAHSVGMRNTPRVRAMYQEPGTIYLYTMHTHRIVNFDGTTTTKNRTGCSQRPRETGTGTADPR